MPTTSEAKITLRQQMLERRRAHTPTPEERDALTQNIVRAVEGFITPPGGAVVAGYIPMGGECDALSAMKMLAERGYQTALPVMQEATHTLIFKHWQPGDALTPGPRGTHEPEPQAGEVTPALLLVPLVAFDLQGGRLGMGAGYYDRTLAALRATNPNTKALGVAFAMQAVEQVPMEGHDEGLDGVVSV